MSDQLVISVDAMGGDHGPPIVVAGVDLALDRLAGRSVRFLLHGDRTRIDAEIARYPRLRDICEVRHTDLVIASDEQPARAMRRGKGSSLWNAIEALRAKEADAAVSAGNTGALMAISKLILRMVGGSDRPAIVAPWPTLRGVTAVLDVGANLDCDAHQLVEFAILGAAYYAAMHSDGSGRPPTVALLNVGSEDMKGHQEVREAHALLREGAFDFDYRGFVEGNDIAMGAVDVIVTDAFTGNVALKTAEGMARFFATTLRAELTSSWINKAGALVASGALKALKARLDPSSVNGGPLLGLNGTVIKSHGGADASGFANALLVAANLAASHYAEDIVRNLARLAPRHAGQEAGAVSEPTP